MNNFSDRLIHLMKQNNVNGTELGRKVNVIKQAVSRWKRNVSTPNYKTLEQLSKFFNVSVSYLLVDNELKEKDLKLSHFSNYFAEFIEDPKNKDIIMEALFKYVVEHK